MRCFHYHAVPRAGEALYSLISPRFIRYPPLPFTIIPHNKSNNVHHHHHHHHRHYCTIRLATDVVKENQQQQIRSPDLVALEYADLYLSDKLSEEVGHVRIRQHVNPLSSASLSIPVQVPDWDQVFRDSTLPLMVDIGSGSGRFLIWHAKRNADSRNYLGLEIRQKLVKRAQFWVKKLAVHNVHFKFANAMVSFEQLVATYPGPLMLVSILCPDPHFKKRHHKRRVVQKPLVDAILNNLAPGGQLMSKQRAFLPFVSLLLDRPELECVLKDKACLSLTQDKSFASTIQKVENNSSLFQLLFWVIVCMDKL